MFTINLCSFGFNNVEFLPPEHEGKGSLKGRHVFRIYGNGLIDKLARGILKILGSIFHSLKPVQVSLDGLPQSKLYMTRKNLENCLLLPLKNYTEERQYDLSNWVLKCNTRTAARTSKVVSLQQTIEDLKGSFDWRVMKQLRDAVISLSEVYDDAKISDHGWQWPIYVQQSTGKITFQDPQDTQWEKGILTVTKDKKVCISGITKQQYSAKALVEGLTSGMTCAANMEDALNSCYDEINQKEYINFVASHIGDPANEEKTEIRLADFGQVALDANRITLHGHKYIASSEHSSKDAGPYWLMASQEKAPLIVKLSETTKSDEDDGEDDRAYWPKLGETVRPPYHLVSVKCTHEETLAPNLVKRTFVVTNLERDTKHTVNQLDFTGWPDGYIPKKENFDQLMAAVDKENIPTNKPIMVHCRAGVGRTGTFITAHSSRGKGSETIPKTIRSLRDQRPGRPMVENPMQYAYIRDYLSKGEIK